MYKDYEYKRTLGFFNFHCIHSNYARRRWHVPMFYLRAFDYTCRSPTSTILVLDQGNVPPVLASDS